ncbi:hypothetical protein PILCRDRAFT_579101 [Piloderma croceum F 1598]|uniref:Uncharacterized protein n=1 Tax=Piloderma croceum (strain F 1598) TaxID=765440 RepID=A0A0C3BNJ0_PILCF|nr:hypothetical protein PILCRDRAFT_579101 [Piloderma croceum F 1598]
MRGCSRRPVLICEDRDDAVARLSPFNLNPAAKISYIHALTFTISSSSSSMYCKGVLLTVSATWSQGLGCSPIFYLEDSNIPGTDRDVIPTHK